MIQVLNNIDPNTPLGKLMLAAAATNDITDEQFKGMFLNYKITNEDEIPKILDVIEKNRPELYKSFKVPVA